MNFSYNSQQVENKGLKASYFVDLSHNGLINDAQQPVLVRTEPQVNVDWGDQSPFAPALARNWATPRWQPLVTYDNAGELASVAYGNGSSLSTVSKDNAARLTSLGWKTSDGKDIVAQVGRTSAGTIIDESLAGVDARPNAPNYVYDGVGRLAEAYVAGHHYTYDTEGNTTGWTAADGSVTTLTWDGSDRNIGARMVGSNPALNANIAYTRDATNRIVRRDPLDLAAW